MMTNSPQLQRVLDLAQAASEQYVAQTDLRQSFLESVQSGLIFASCMDGRSRPMQQTGLPLGVANEFRKGGVALDYASAGFRQRINDMVRERRDQPDIFFHVVHTSEHPDKDCGYWKNRGGLAAAVGHGLDLAECHTAAHEGELFTVLLCHNTDTDAYSVYDRRATPPQFVPIAALPQRYGTMEVAIHHLFPEFPTEVISDLTMIFNLHCEWLLRVRAREPVSEANGHHVEDTILVGQRFAYIAECKNVFLIDEKCGGVAEQVLIAGKIIGESVAEGRVRFDGDNRLLLLTQIPWRTDPDVVFNRRNRQCAIVGATCQSQRLHRIFSQTYPDLSGHVQSVAAIIDETYRLELL